MSELRTVALEEVRAVEGRVRDVFGASAEIVVQSPAGEGPLRSRAPFFTAYEVAPTKAFGLWTYISAGSLSGAMAADPHNVEFVISSAVQDPRMVQRLAVNSYYHCGPDHQRLDLGHRVSVGEPWVPGATVDSALVSLPYPYGEELEYVHWNGRHTRVLWLMPITKAELDLASQEGNERLEQLFEANQVAFTDLFRPSVI